MSDPVDRMTLDELNKLREDWIYDLQEKQDAYNLLMRSIPHLVFADVATMDDWNAAAQTLRGRARVVNQQIIELQTLIHGVESRIWQLETYKKRRRCYDG